MAEVRFGDIRFPILAVTSYHLTLVLHSMKNFSPDPPVSLSVGPLNPSICHLLDANKTAGAIQQSYLFFSSQ